MSEKWQWLRHGLHTLVELFFPKKCVSCNRRLVNEDHVCTHCMLQLPRTFFHLNPENQLVQRFWSESNMEQATGYFYYSKEAPFRYIVYELKYYGNQSLAHYMGTCIVSHIGKEHAFWKGIDCIVPIPLSKERLKKRGYNQCEAIAQGISQESGIPMNTNILLRVVDNPTQTRLKKLARWENSKDIFMANPTYDFQGKHLLLLDDVVTTGSTLISCIRAIHRKYPNCHISVMALSVVPQL